MIKAGNPVIDLYVEETPNPETMKFVFDKLLFPGKSADFHSPDSASASPLAKELFNFPFVKSVFIASNFITITKTFEFDEWTDLLPDIKRFLKEYIEEGKEVINKEELSKRKEESTNIIFSNDEDIVKRIKELLEDYINPAVEMDGGTIQFISYDDGVVNLDMQGACSGCPSSLITLKSGVERILKQRIPQIKKVVSANCIE